MKENYEKLEMEIIDFELREKVHMEEKDDFPDVSNPGRDDLFG